MQKTSTKILNTLFLNVPITLVLCMFAQMLSIWKGQAENFSIQMFGINCIIAYISATIVGLALPSVRWGMTFARKCGVKDDTFVFALLMNVVVNTIFTFFLSIVMTFVNVYIIADAPIIAVVFGVIENFLPIWAVCYIVSFVCSPICQKLAVKLTE